MIAQLLLTGLLGGVVAADATAVAQILISQPLVGAALTGLLWGDFTTAVQVGALLQLFALARLPLGGRTPDDYASAGVVGPAVAILLDRSVPLATSSVVHLLGVVVGLAVALAGRPVLGWLRHRNESLVRWSDREVSEGRTGALDLSHWLGVGSAIAVGSGVTLVGVLGGTVLVRWGLSFDAVALSRAADAAEPILWGIGTGLAIRQFVSFRQGSGAVFLAVLAMLLALRLAAVP